jgi:hypothetical protein
VSWRREKGGEKGGVENEGGREKGGREKEGERRGETGVRREERGEKGGRGEREGRTGERRGETREDDVAKICDAENSVIYKLNSAGLKGNLVRVAFCLLATLLAPWGVARLYATGIFSTSEMSRARRYYNLL